MVQNREAPAFPIEPAGGFPHYGLTQRQFYAAAALPALLRNDGGCLVCDAEQLARKAFELDDAMLDEGGQ